MALTWKFFNQNKIKLNKTCELLFLNVIPQYTSYNVKGYSKVQEIICIFDICCFIGT